jgi:cardiolipin synthase (CMP-forming)
VADKLMVAAALCVLLKLGRVDAVIAFIIIGREIAISALREWMAQIGASKNVAVNMLGKVKTVAQLVALPMLLFHDDFLGLFNAHLVGTILIYGAAFLTVWSMFYYLKAAWPVIQDKG